MPATDESANSGALRAQLEWLFAQQRFGVKLGLERVEALLAQLGHPERTFEVILVGGTNGKGSCAATLAATLQAAGRCTALFTSPHLTRFSERFRIDGAEVSAAELLAGLSTLRPHAEATGATFFEIVTALGCWLFARRDVAIAVFEVGLGGRFDATNALAPRLSLITGVALDHTETLGDTLAKIAFEKAGIMRPAILTLTGAVGAALEVVRRTAAELGSPLWVLADDTGDDTSDGAGDDTADDLDAEITLEATDLGWSGLRCTVASPAGSLTVTTPLLGRHQARNVALAVAAAQALGVSKPAVRQGVAQTRWAGRLEPLEYQTRTFLLDGAHNPQAASALAAAIGRLSTTEQFNKEPVTLVFGAAADKDLTGLVAALAPAVAQVVVTRAALSPRAASPETLAELWQTRLQAVTVADTPAAALATALGRTAPGSMIVVAGSLYLVGEVRPLLLAEPTEPWSRLQ